MCHGSRLVWILEPDSSYNKFYLIFGRKKKEKKNDELEEKRRNKKIETMKRSQERGKLTYVRKERIQKFIT